MSNEYFSADSLDYNHPCPLHRRITALHIYSEQKKELGSYDYNKEKISERRKYRKRELQTMDRETEAESNIRSTTGKKDSDSKTITEKQIIRGNSKHKKKVPIGKNGKRYYPLAVYK